MKEGGARTRSTLLGRMGFLLVLVAALGAQAEPPSSTLPGRKPDSREPWGAFLGKSAHEVIGLEYRVQHPSSVVFLNIASLSAIVEEGKLGDPKRLSKAVRLLRPDITDTRALVLFELKPDNEESRREGREQAKRYLTALNEVVEPDKKLAGGTRFEGSLFLEFDNGGALWQLSWLTPEPGVTLYRWSELAEQALRAVYEGGEYPKGFQGQIYLPVDCR
jgi:hypothetical protein